MSSNARKSAIAVTGVALLLAGGGCGSEDPSNLGSISVTLTASGSGIGKTGNVIVSVRDCTGTLTTTFTDNSLVAKTLASGTPLNVPAFSDVPAGPSWCVLAFLDVNGSLMRDTGDIGWSGGELGVAVEAGANTPVVLDLNTVY